MKLRKTLAGILGAVVMLLGVGTFEHVNRDTGVHAAAVKWQLVEDVSSLTVGDKIVIASNNSTKGTFAAGAISSSVLSSVSVSISSDKKEITSLPSTVLQFTLGGSTGKWTFTNGGKLLGTSAVKKVALGSGTTTWGISIGTSGDATISSTNSSYGKILYNRDSPRFTTYTSATSVSMLLPQIYKEVKVAEAGTLGIPQLNLNVYNGEVSWGKIDNAIRYEYTINDGTPIETTETSVVLTDGQSIKVKAIGDGTNYSNSGYSDPVTYEKIQVTSTIQSWISTYSNDGVYTKKSQIYLNYEAQDEVIQYFHQDDELVHQNRTTYYNKDALFMSNLDGSIGGENGINSGYRTNGTNLEHFVLNSNNEAIKDWGVKNTTLKEFFVTLDTFNQDNYFDSWKVISEKEAVFTPVGESLILDNNCDSVQDMLAFAAPCLETTILYTNYIKLSKLSISKETNSTYGDYLSFKIYVSEGDITKVTDKNLLLSEARVYADNKVFDEKATAKLNINKTGEGTVTYNNQKERYLVGEEVTFTLTPAEGYEINSISYNSKSIDIANNLGCNVTVTIEEPTTINKFDVTFTKIPAEGEITYTYTFTSKVFSSNATKSLGDKSWTLTGDGDYWNYDGTKGQQFGSKNNPYNSLTLTSESFNKVKEIKINTCGASGINTNLTVFVGGTQVENSVNITATTLTEYVFTCDTLLNGEIVISYNSTAAKAIYIKSISVTYSE